MARPSALAAVALALTSACYAPPRRPAGAQDFGPPGPYPRVPRQTQITGAIGSRSFDDSSWEPLENQFVTGLSLAEPIEGLFWLEGGIQYSYDSANISIGAFDEHIRTSLFDLYLGFLLQPRFGYRLRPYGGAGFAMRNVEFEGEELGMFVREDDISLGGYGKLGLRLEIYPGAFIGMEVRAFQGDPVRLNSTNLETDSLQVVFVSGTGS